MRLPIRRARFTSVGRLVDHPDADGTLRQQRVRLASETPDRGTRGLLPLRGWVVRRVVRTSGQACAVSGTAPPLARRTAPAAR
jgi:hypothetical protein